MIYKKRDYKYIVAIDPDVDESGYAYLIKETRKLDISRWRFPNILDMLKTISVSNIASDTIIVVEAGWLNRGNWHLHGAKNRKVAGKTGEHIGANHQVGKLIIEMCKHYGLNVIAHKPLIKTWSTASGKISRKELAYVTGLDKQSNTEERDAGILAWVFAGLPVKVPPLNKM